MAIILKCPNPKCGRTLSVPAEMAGAMVKCNACGQSFQAPLPAKASQGSETPRPTESADPLIGTKIAHYRIQALLGEGGMGKVYKAHNTSLDKTCAIKILPPEFAKQDQTNIDRFVREARSAAKVEHTNVLPVQFVGKVAEHYFIEMQYVDGGTLQGPLTQKGRLEVKEAAQIIRDVAAGLQAAHAKGIIHRDIKPTNVMLTRDRHVYVMDFGLAKSAHARSALTVSGTIMGTPLYMSPEQALGQPVDHRSDIYSLGVMFYQLLTGTPPYTADSPLVILNMHQSGPIPDIHQAAPEAPGHIGDMIRKMMAKNPAERYQSCGEIVDELNGFLTTGGATVTVSEEALKDAPDHRRSVLARAKRGGKPRTPGAPPKKRLAMPVTLVLVLLLVLVLGFYFVKTRFTAETQRAQRTGTAETTKTTKTQSTPRTETAQESVPPAVQEKSPRDDVYVTQAATGEKIPHPLSRKTYKQTLPDGTTIDVSEGMVYVPAGEFTMGVSTQRDNYGPPHKVWLDGYFIGKHEVTNAEWKAFLDATWYVPLPQHWRDGKIPQGRENHPVVYVSWEDVQKYCEWVSKQTGQDVRLPTEAQWEKAARGSKEFKHSWGDTWDYRLCNNGELLVAEFCGRPPDQLEDWKRKINDLWNSPKWKEIGSLGGNTMPVGSFPQDKSGYGCYDMTGNVREWCSDWYKREYYTQTVTKNPQGPTEADADTDLGDKHKRRSARGGEWGAWRGMCVVYGRYNDPPTTRKNLMGFRIVVLPSAAAGAAAPRAGAVTEVAPVERPGPQSPSVQSAKSPWDDAYVATAATGEKIPHPLSRKTYKQTLADGTTIEVPEGMVYVPAGEFTMGEKESEHKVYLDAYFIGKYEVTNAEWKVFRDVTSSVPPPKSWEGGQIPVGKENHPVVFVCWGWIQEYCEWVTRLRQGFGGQGAGTTWELRLPTEAQWERAARGPKGYVYPWGSEWNPKCCNWRGMWAAKYGLEFNITEGVPLNQWMAFAKSEKYGQETRSGLTMPVGSFPNGKSFYGCYDMAGNASEFCGDWFRRDYYGLKDAGRNPQGPSEEDAEECDLSGKKGKARVVRGGFWSGNSMDCRSVERSRSFPASSNTTNGFRVVVVGTR